MKMEKVKEKHYSPVKFMLEAKRKFSQTIHGEFVPFGHERDGLGRLIRHNCCETQPRSPFFNKLIAQECNVAKLIYTKTPSTCITVEEKVNLIQDQIQRSFQYKDPKEIKIYETNKIKLKKPKAITLQKQLSQKSNKKVDLEMNRSKPIQGKAKEPKKYSIQKVVVKNIMNQISCKSLPSIDQCSTPKKKVILKKKMSLIELQNMANKKLKLQKINQRSVKRIPEVIKPQKQKQKINLFNPEYKSLESHKRWPKLNKIQGNNQLFMTKMWSTKRLACEIKRNLEEAGEF